MVYRITAVHSTRRGEPADFIVNLSVAEASTYRRASDPNDYRLAG